MNPQVAVAPDGAVTAVWYRSNGSNNIVQAATRPAGSAAWDAPVNLSLPGYSAGNPQVAVAPSGETTAVWYRPNGSFEAIQTATRPAGSNVWGATVDLSLAGGNAANPQVAVSTDGAAAAVWRRYNGVNFVTQAATRSAGSASWGAPVSLSAVGPSASGQQIAISPDGAVTAVWSCPDGANEIIQAATRPAGSSVWGAPVDLSSAGQNAATAQVVVAPSGATTVVWQRSNGSHTIIQSSIRPAGSNTWSSAVDLSAAGQNATAARLGVASDGAVTAAWQRSDGTNTIIQTATRPAGSLTWDAPIALSAAGQNATSAHVTVSPDGASTVAWQRSNGSNTIIQAATRPAGSALWGAPEDLSAIGQSAVNPKVAVALDGATTAVWYRSNGTNNIIQAATSLPVSHPLTIATGGTGNGTVSSSPAGISCGTACTATFVQASTVTVTASPAAGSTFTGWSGACSGAATTCQVTMRGPTSATATFTASSTPPTDASSNSTPSNALNIVSVKASGAAVIARITVPGAGKIAQKGTYSVSAKGRKARARIACRASRTVAAGTTLTLRCPLTAAARKARARAALRVRVATTFTPTGGAARTTTRTVTFKARPPR